MYKVQKIGNTIADKREKGGHYSGKYQSDGEKSRYALTFAKGGQ